LLERSEFGRDPDDPQYAGQVTDHPGDADMIDFISSAAADAKVNASAVSH
jgi:hypothetical protein